MARLGKIRQNALRELTRIRNLERGFQITMARDFESLSFVSEYVFLSAYKSWEHYIEELFIAFSRYNEKVGRKKPSPFIDPDSEIRSKNILRLERDYLDWTSPDTVLKRSEILFRNHEIISIPIASQIDLLRDAKKLRNHIAHQTFETEAQFLKITRRRLNRNVSTAGEFLLSQVRGSNQHYNLHLLDTFEQLVNSTSS